MIPELLVLAGSVLTLISAIGATRFRDVYARLHSLTKASTIGVVLVLSGAAIGLSSANDITSLALAALLQLLTSPLAANMISVATYAAEGTDHAGVELDELRTRRGGQPPSDSDARRLRPDEADASP